MRSIQQHRRGTASRWLSKARRGTPVRGSVCCVAFLIVFLGTTLVPADVLVLRNGSTVKGRIALETDQLIVVEVGGGGRVHIAKKKVAEVIRDRRLPAANDEGRPRSDLLFLKNGASVKGKILLETRQFITLRVGGVGTVRYDKRHIARVVRAKRTRSGKEEATPAGKPPRDRESTTQTPEPDAASDTGRSDPQGESDGTMGGERSAWPGDQPAKWSSKGVESHELPKTMFGDRQALEALGRLLDDAADAPELPLSSLGSPVSDQDLQSVVQAAREAFEAQGRLLSVLEELEAQQRSRPATPETSPPKLGEQEVSPFLETLKQAANQPQAGTLLRELPEKEPRRSSSRSSPPPRSTRQ